ncbi:hypothetical protein DOY81_013957 [Sarcophaga bullata]|nr:hypothetical protein DOY81_013957 [Sarcophaga bullata]
MFVWKLFNIMFVLAIFGQYTSSQAQIITSGDCPCDVEVVADFDVSKYLGTWLMVFAFRLTYSLQSDGNVAVKNSQVNGTTGEADEY